MRPRKPECVNCGDKKKVRLYWSTKNLLKQPLKTFYCATCAKNIIPGQDWIREKEGA